SQPSMPFPVSRKHRRDLGISDADLVQVRARCAAGTPVMGLRFTGDRGSPGERFERLREELGDRFIGIEIDSSSGNPHGLPRNAPRGVTPPPGREPGPPARVGARPRVPFLPRGPAGRGPRPPPPRYDRLGPLADVPPVWVSTARAYGRASSIGGGATGPR